MTDGAFGAAGTITGACPARAVLGGLSDVDVRGLSGDEYGMPLWIAAGRSVLGVGTGSVIDAGMCEGGMTKDTGGSACDAGGGEIDDGGGKLMGLPPVCDDGGPCKEVGG